MTLRVPFCILILVVAMTAIAQMRIPQTREAHSRIEKAKNEATFFRTDNMYSTFNFHIRSGGVPISKDDEIAPLLVEYKQQISDRYVNCGDHIIPQISEWIEIKTEATQRLFPNLRFTSIAWNETKNPERTDSIVGMAFGLHVTLAIDVRDKSVIAELRGSGNYEAFGELLATKEIVLRNEEDAAVIWDAFCDLHKKFWKNQPYEKHSDTQWRLGLYSNDQTISSDAEFKTIVTNNYYYLIYTHSKSHRILDGRLTSERTNERRIPIDSGEAD